MQILIYGYLLLENRHSSFGISCERIARMSLETKSDNHLLAFIKGPMQVRDFYRDRNIFITGVTGFLGKVLVEKLLRSIPDIGIVYVLTRAKNGCLAEERIQKLFDLELFSKIKDENPALLNKVVPVEGDVTSPGLGLSAADRTRLAETVSVVIHVAASVRFDECLADAFKFNVRGTKEVIGLALEMKKIKAFVYVSTAYSNTEKPVISESVEPCEYDWEEMLKLVENTDPYALKIMTEKLIRQFPNTYAFSKRNAENLVHSHRDRLPVIIIRPSIVAVTAREPFPGWVDTINGPIAPNLGLLTGVIHVFYCNADLVNDYVPCDMVVNGIILAACYRGYSTEKDCLAINAAAGARSVSIKTIFDTSLEFLEDIPPSKMLYKPFFVFTVNTVLYHFMVYFTHLLPAFLIDIVLRLKGVEFSLMRLYRKIYITNQMLQYFTTNEWFIETDKFQSLHLLIAPEERPIFCITPEDVDDYQFMRNIYISAKKLMLKEESDAATVRAAKNNYRRMCWLDFVIRKLALLGIAWLLIKYFYETMY